MPFFEIGWILIIGAVIYGCFVVMIRGIREERKLYLFDLHKYEHDCMRWKQTRSSIMPPPMIPAGNFSEDELAILRDNRNQAQEIYRRYGGSR